MQIIVLGAHRSGTSMVTRLINMMGAYFGLGESSIGANIENPKGFWERGDVIAVNEAILTHFGCAWDRLAKWQFADKPPVKDMKALDPTIQAMQKVILELDASRPWVIKDPRMCLTFPYWRSLLEVPVVVCVYRNPQEVARSLKTRNNFSLSYSMALWEYYATGIANAVHTTPTVYVSHADLLSDPVLTVKKLYDDLASLDIRGLSLPSEREITTFIDPALYRSKGNEASMTDMMTDYQKRLVSYVSGKEHVPDALQKPTELASDLIASLDQFSQTVEKLETHHQRYSEVEQRKNELENQIESYKRETAHVRAEYGDVITKLRAENEALKTSTSWKVGHRLVRIGRTLTLQGSGDSKQSIA